jgi:hypothetical protein
MVRGRGLLDKKKAPDKADAIFMAEEEGFEPSLEIAPY